MFNREDKLNSESESESDSDVEDFTVRTVDLIGHYNTQYNDSESDEEKTPSSEAAIEYLNSIGRMNFADRFADGSDTDSDTASNHSLSSYRTNFLSSVSENTWDEVSDEEKLTAEEQTKRDSFKQLVEDIFDKETPGYLDLLELPAYKPHKVAICQGLLKLETQNQRHAVKIAAVFFARENALHVAHAIHIFEKHNIIFSHTTFMQAAHLRLIDAGEDAETIALAISASVTATTKSAYEHLNLMLMLKHAGVILTDTLCMVIVKAPALTSHQVVESFIALQAAGILTDHFCMDFAFYDQYNNSKSIIDLLLTLKDKIQLTDEVVNLLIINGAIADEIIKDISKLAEPSDIKTAIEKRCESNHPLIECETLNISSQLKLKDAGISLTVNLRSFLDQATKLNTIEDLVKAFSALKNAEIPTEHLQLTLDLYNQYLNLEHITALLILLKPRIPLTSELFNFVSKNGSSAKLLNEQMAELIDAGIKPSVEILTAILQSTSVEVSIAALLSLHSIGILPNVMLTDQPEMKSSVLTVSAVQYIIKHRNSSAACTMLDPYRAEIELIDDLIIEGILTRAPIVMPGILKLYLSLKRDDLSLEEDKIANLYYAILCGTEKNHINNLMQTDHLEKEKVVKHIREGNLALILPTPLWNCVFSYFAAPARAPNQGCKVELEENVASDRTEQKRYK